MELLILSAEEVRQALPMAEAIEAMKEAYRQLSTGEAAMPLRSRIEVPDEATVALFMPAYLKTTRDLAIKIVTVAPHNPAQGLPTIHALVVALDAATGRPLALMEGASLTAIRTGAGSGAATDLLARPDANTVAIFGSGTQARTQLQAVCTVRPIQRAWVYSPTGQHAEAFAQEMAGQGPIPEDLRVAASPEEAIAEADIICTATTSHTPVFDGRLLRPGTHVNAVGSFTPEMQEVDLETIRRSLVVVDSREAVLEEAGELITAIREGVFSPEQIHAEVGEIVAGLKPGRTSPEQITYFKSVGVAVQDAAAATATLEGALRAGLGRVVDL